tara:strand:+ start:2542 stop:3027 length:486 start_codon:yes stop_codon:yes gene_type:complete
MALANKKYEKFYETTGTGKDKINSDKLSSITAAWAVDKAEGCAKYIEDPVLAPLVYQLQQMQDELDELRTEISTNKDKATFPGFGTSSTTALAGDTTTISTSQASAITANTAKVSQNLKTANHTMQFDVVNSKGAYTLTITVIDATNAKSPVTKTVTLNLK